MKINPEQLSQADGGFPTENRVSVVVVARTFLTFEQKLFDRRAELGGSHSRLSPEDAAQMALVGKTGTMGDLYDRQ